MDNPIVEEKTDRLEIVVAILIAIVVFVAGLVAWQASRVDDAAGDADYEGLRAAVNAEETRALNFVNAYESYGNYVNYWRNRRMADLLAENLEQAPEEEVDLLVAQMKVANDLADANDDMFETRYLNRDGSYNVQRQLGEMWADASREKDLDASSKFAEADTMRTRTNRLLIAMMVLTIAPVFFSLVESVGSRGRYVMVGLGSTFLVLGTALAILASMGKF